MAEDHETREQLVALRVTVEKLEQRLDKGFEDLKDSIAGKDWVKALERRVEALESALEKRTEHLEEILGARIGKIESTFRHLVWLVITPVVLGMLALVLKTVA